MGLSKDSTGLSVIDMDFAIKKTNDADKVVALGGNPNVGKSTVFNELTGLRQHTGNWPGKTVASAQGYCDYRQDKYILVDLPGCYSLIAHSAEEEVARDFICLGQPDAVVIVCDATCLERNLNLVLQTIEMTPKVVVCVNLMDEARKRKIKIDLQAVSKRLGVPVVGTAARSKEGLDALMQSVNQIIESSEKPDCIKTQYPDYIETAVSVLEPCIKEVYEDEFNARWLSLLLLHGDESMYGFINKNSKDNIMSNESVAAALKDIRKNFSNQGITGKQVEEDIVSAFVRTAENICKDTVTFENKEYKNRDIKIDSILTGKWTAFPIMVLALLGVFWLTITGANYPSQLISNFLFWIEDKLLEFAVWTGAPQLLYEMLILGVYRVLAWVVSVMLPPMAIFFPLFTLLEDVGFLPRIAFNLDRYFKRCCACGKQALTMWAGNLCYACLYAPCLIKSITMSVSAR